MLKCSEKAELFAFLIDFQYNFSVGSDTFLPCWLAMALKMRQPQIGVVRASQVLALLVGTPSPVRS